MNKKLAVMRVLTAIGLGALIVGVVFVVAFNPTEKNLFPCQFYKLTQIKCPTCGATRMVYCFFTLQLGKAFYYHAYFTVTSPLVGYALITLVVNVFKGRRVLPYPKRWYIWLAVYFCGLATFGVVRNFIPYFY